MIKLKTARNPAGAEPEVWMNIDDIMLLQRQTPVDGKDLTAVFFRTDGKPPYMVEERPDEIAEKIMQARAARRDRPFIFGMDRSREKQQELGLARKDYT